MKKRIFSMILVSCMVSTLLPVESFAESLTQNSKVTQDSSQTEESETTVSTSTEATTETTTSETTGTTDSTSSSSLPSKPVDSTTNSSSANNILDPQTQVETPTGTEQSVVEEAVDSTPISFEKNGTTEEFIVHIGEYARKVGQEEDLFASVMIAQAILESGSGSSQLAQEPINNLFGIKGSYEEKSISFSTLEDDGSGTPYAIDAAFRVYPSAKESFQDYSKLLKEGIEGNPAIYQGAWKSQSETYQKATLALTGTYATDTRYNEKLDALIETYNLTQYDLEKGNFIISDSDFESYNNNNYDTQNAYAFGNCTQYVYNRITQLGGLIDLTMGNGKDWGTTGKDRGYEVTHVPKAGTAVSFNPSVLGSDPSYGHVAFVEKVYEDGAILISEMNAVGLNVISTRTIQPEYTGLLTYITPKNHSN